ncbi:MAG TPA: preprotein translocase subunit SecY [Candidatus Saccharimonadales bacterium]|nr:preprotein translocase subunit SecY [Candidatus Saccharimonadales bacterium]
MLKTLQDILRTPDLRNKILFTLGVIFVYRMFAHIPIPGVDPDALKNLFSSSQIFQLLDLFTGGTLLNFSIIALGLNPYINASIIMQLLGIVVPKIEELQKEGEYGRQKINQWTRYITVPLAFVQSYAVLVFLHRGGTAVVGQLNLFETLGVMLTLTAGTIFLMWLGELITEQGIGNGISVIIFVGIVARLPVTFSQLGNIVTAENILMLAALLVAALVIIGGVVVGTEGQRKILVQYAKRVRGNRLYGGQSTYLPIRINQAGVIPIIFAVSLILLPGIVGQLFSTSPVPLVKQLATWGVHFSQNVWLYSSIYFALVVIFTYFYTSIIFNPTKVADDIKKYGGFIPGIRPGKATADYLGFISNRITLVGACFLGFLAILPFVLKEVTNISAVAFGGTGLLIVVSVVLETTKQLESQLIMRSYEGFLDK